MRLDRPPSETPDPPGSILVLESGVLGAADRLCGRLLTPAVDGPVGLIVVSLVQPAATRLSLRDGAEGDPAERTVVVTLDSIAALGPDPPDDDVEFKTVSAPDNLTRLGVALTEALAAVDGTTPVLCFHSLSILIQYAGASQVTRFLNVLDAHLDAVDAVAHFHLDPTAHDERTVETLRHLFDDVVTVDD